MLHVRHGKGGKDRYVPLPQRTVELLREYWVSHRNPVWMFPSKVRQVELKKSTAPLGIGSTGIPSGTKRNQDQQSGDGAHASPQLGDASA
jgi:hypothetical protein